MVHDIYRDLLLLVLKVRLECVLDLCRLTDIYVTCMNHDVSMYEYDYDSTYEGFRINSISKSKLGLSLYHIDVFFIAIALFIVFMIQSVRISVTDVTCIYMMYQCIPGKYEYEYDYDSMTMRDSEELIQSQSRRWAYHCITQMYSLFQLHYLLFFMIQ